MLRHRVRALTPCPAVRNVSQCAVCPGSLPPPHHSRRQQRRASKLRPVCSMRADAIRRLFCRYKPPHSLEPVRPPARTRCATSARSPDARAFQPLHFRGTHSPSRLACIRACHVPRASCRSAARFPHGGSSGRRLHVASPRCFAHHIRFLRLLVPSRRIEGLRRAFTFTLLTPAFVCASSLFILR